MNREQWKLLARHLGFSALVLLFAWGVATPMPWGFLVQIGAALGVWAVLGFPDLV